MKHQKHYKRFLFLLAMLLTVTFAVAQTDERTKKQKDYLSFIQGQTISPFDYLSQKIKQYNVVSLGEDHWIKDHMLFLADYPTVLTALSSFVLSTSSLSLILNRRCSMTYF